MSSICSKDLLAGWLGYLEEEKVARALVGTKSKLNILQAAEKWSFLQGEEFYCLECPLLGEAGMDFALQYSTDSFLRSGGFTGRLGSQYNRFLSLYSQKAGPKKHFYLEIDTGFGDSDKLAIFLELPDVNKTPIISLALGAVGKTQLLPKLEVLFDRAKELKPIMLGSMLSRLNVPLRVCFSPQEHNLKKPDRLQAMRNFLAVFPNTDKIIEDLIEIERTEFLDCFLDVDMYPDGNIGAVFGLELMCCVHSLEQQHMMLESQQFHDFKCFLEKYGLIDERIGCLERCCFYAPLPKTEINEAEEKLFSMISHFKLSYKNGERQPAKVYLQGDRG